MEIDMQSVKSEIDSNDYQIEDQSLEEENTNKQINVAKGSYHNQM